MNRCTHCGYRNDNRFYCAGCGRRMIPPQQTLSRGAAGGVPPLLTELTAAVERIFPSAGQEDPAIISYPVMSGIDLNRIAAESGVVLAAGGTWRPIEGRATAKMYFSEMLFVFGISFLIAVGAHVLGDVPFLAAVKLYFTMFIAFSLLCWTLAPYLFGSSPIALAFFHAFLVKDSHEPARGDGMTALLLWLVSLCYSLPPLLIAEYLYLILVREHYQPLPFQLAAIRYMKAM